MSQEAKAAVAELEACCRKLCEIAATARRNGKSIAGTDKAAHRFNDAAIALTQAERKLKPVVDAAGAWGELSGLLEVVKAPRAADKQRKEAVKRIGMLCRGDLLPAIEAMETAAVPQTERVIPMELVRGTRGYIEKLAIQINGCYELGWYDGCALVLRKLIETLIIEVYETNRRTADILDGSGNFPMLGELIARLTADPAWTLGKDTNAVLPHVKDLGNRSAHVRRYNARKSDIDHLVPRLRLAVEELLHLAHPKAQQANRP